MSHSQHATFSAYCNELKDLVSTFDVCSKTIKTVHATDLQSVVNVLESTNEWFKRFYSVETRAISDSGAPTKTTRPRSCEVSIERLTELYMIHSHFDVCSHVISSLNTGGLASLSKVLQSACVQLYCLYEEQLTLSSKEAA